MKQVYVKPVMLDGGKRVEGIFPALAAGLVVGVAAGYGAARAVAAVAKKVGDDISRLDRLPALEVIEA